ncbi:MAG: multi antimicrobial extrusion protein MatE [Firmicutes bacterium]|nr:multi antimicrobial extrusion protein MatE [Bacillota bacterium]
MQMKKDRNIRILRSGGKADRFFEKQLDSPLFTYRQIFSMLFPLILDQFFINTISLLTTAMISSSSQESVTAVSLVARDVEIKKKSDPLPVRFYYPPFSWLLSPASSWLLSRIL